MHCADRRSRDDEMSRDGHLMTKPWYTMAAAPADADRTTDLQSGIGRSLRTSAVVAFMAYAQSTQLLKSDSEIRSRI